MKIASTPVDPFWTSTFRFTAGIARIKCVTRVSSRRSNNATLSRCYLSCNDPSNVVRSQGRGGFEIKRLQARTNRPRGTELRVGKPEFLIRNIRLNIDEFNYRSLNTVAAASNRFFSDLVTRGWRYAAFTLIGTVWVSFVSSWSKVGTFRFKNIIWIKNTQQQMKNIQCFTNR